MRRWISGSGTATVAVVGLVSAIIGVLGWAVPSLRDWLGARPALAWTACAVMGVVGPVVVLQILRQLREERLEVDRLKVSVRDLEARRQPTDHDLSFFATLMDYFAWDKVPMVWLREFAPKRWHSDQSGPLYEFIDGWSERYFDDEQVQAAYVAFWEAAGALGGWLVTEGAPDHPDDVRIVRMVDPDRRHGGYPEHAKAVQTALRLRDDLFAARRSLERVGRERGLRVMG